MKLKIFGALIPISLLMLGFQNASAACETKAAPGTLVDINSCGKLIYGNYSNNSDTRATNKVPDFSNAGFMGGGVPLPNTDDFIKQYQKSGRVKILSPQNLSGKVGDDRVRIEKEIRELGKLSPTNLHSLRGVVILKKGVYRISSPIRLDQSGVVLRGEGESLNGTILVGTYSDNTFKECQEYNQKELAKPEAQRRFQVCGDSNFKKCQDYNKQEMKKPEAQRDLKVCEVARKNLISVGPSKDSLEKLDEKLYFKCQDDAREDLMNGIQPQNESECIKGHMTEDKIVAQTELSTTFVPVGSRQIHVKDASKFPKDSSIQIVRRPNTKWLQDIRMSNIGTGSWSVAAGQKFETLTIRRKVVSRSYSGPSGSHTLVLDTPILDAIDTNYNKVSIQRVREIDNIWNVGLEKMRLISEYQLTDPALMVAMHTDSPSQPSGQPDVPNILDYSEDLRSEFDENHTWTAVEIRNVTNGWARNIVTQYFGGSGILVTGSSSRVTVEDTAVLSPRSLVTGMRRYSFNIGGGARNVLFQRCYTDLARHGFVTANQVPGPIVWVDSMSTNALSADGPHQRWATGLLYDNVLGRGYLNKETNVRKTNTLAVRNMTSSGGGHGWIGAQVMFWRTDYDQHHLEAAPGTQSWAVGVKGPVHVSKYQLQNPDDPKSIKTAKNPKDPKAELGLVQNRAPVRSLYFSQLTDRTSLEAMKSVTRLSQRNGQTFSRMDEKAQPGKIWDVTAKIDPTCARGLRGSDGICCSAKCGRCADDKKLSASCQPAKIRADRKMCNHQEAPCIIPVGG